MMTSTNSIPSISIWMIEDDKGTRDTYKNILNNVMCMACPNDFEHAEACIEFLSYYRHKAKPWTTPDVLLLDIGLPGISGIEAISAIKEQLPQTRIIMLTNYNEPDNIYDSFRAGASGYLLKTARIDQVIEAIRQAYHGGLLMPGLVAERVLEFFTTTPVDQEHALTERQLQVLAKMAEGYTQEEIADQIHISRNTVNTHVQKIYQVLHVRCAAEAVAKAIRNNWI